MRSSAAAHSPPGWDEASTWRPQKCFNKALKAEGRCFFSFSDIAFMLCMEGGGHPSEFA